MGVRVTVKRRFVVGGREYGSVEELPEGIRSAVEAALGRRGPGCEHVQTHGVHTGIVVNGHTYGSIDDMPADVRADYDAAVAAIEPEGGPSQAGVAGAGRLEDPVARPRAAFTSARPIEPGTPTSPATLRALVFGLAALIVLLGFYFYVSRLR